MLQNPIDTIIFVVLAALIAWLLAETRQLKSTVTKEVDERTPEQWHWLLSELAKTFVKAAQQKYTELEPTVKYNYVKEQMYAQLKSYGIPLTDAMITQIDAMIEAAVHDVKNELLSSAPIASLSDTPK